MSLPEQPVPRAATTTLPTLPDVLDALPSTTERVVVATSDQPVHYKWDDSGQIKYFPGPPTKQESSDGLHRSYEFKERDSWPRLSMQLVRYWQLIDSQLVGAGRSYQARNEVTRGMEKNETDTLSVELGFEAGGVSAKVAASFSTSLTISETSTWEKTWDVSSPDGSDTRWALWQLVDEFIVVDEHGDQARTGHYGVLETEQTDGGGNWQGDLSLEETRWINPTNQFTTTTDVRPKGSLASAT